MVVRVHEQMTHKLKNIEDIADIDDETITRYIPVARIKTYMIEESIINGETYFDLLANSQWLITRKSVKADAQLALLQIITSFAHWNKGEITDKLAVLDFPSITVSNESGEAHAG